jgi:hypothetical protein
MRMVPSLAMALASSSRGGSRRRGSCTTLVEGLYLLCNGLCLLLLYYNQMIIMHMNLLDCICLDTR